MPKLKQPPAAFLEAYWEDVADALRNSHHASATEIPKAIQKFRRRMTSAGQTLYNDNPAEIAKTIVAHGLIASAPSTGICLQLTFELTDPAKVLTNTTAFTGKVAKLIVALSDCEQKLGGAGLEFAGMEAAPGFVQLYLKPAKYREAIARLDQIAKAIQSRTSVISVAEKFPDMTLASVAVARRLSV